LTEKKSLKKKGENGAKHVSFLSLVWHGTSPWKWVPRNLFV